MFRERRFQYYWYESGDKSKRPDFGTSIVPRRIADLIKRHGESLIGEVVGTRSGTYYVVRGINYMDGEQKMLGFRATQLGDYTKSRPHKVFMPGNSSAYITNDLKNIVLSTNNIEYRKILEEINEEGGNVEIPPIKKTGFDIF